MCQSLLTLDKMDIVQFIQISAQIRYYLESVNEYLFRGKFWVYPKSTKIDALEQKKYKCHNPIQ